jgi:hypothetical protein
MTDKLTRKQLQRVIDRQMPGYVIRPKQERHGKPESGDPYFRTVEQLKARYARGQKP